MEACAMVLHWRRQGGALAAPCGSAGSHSRTVARAWGRCAGTQLGE